MRPKSHASLRDIERPQSRREELAERIACHVAKDGVREAAPGLFLSRFSSPVGPIYRVIEPSFCVVVQGTKEILLGKERYQYDPYHYLLISAGLPLVGQVIEASEERPCLGVRVVLDPAILTSVLIEAGHLTLREDSNVRALAVSQLDSNLVDAVTRLVRLVDTPSHYAVLAPLAVREIVYRLSLGEQGGRLLQIAITDSRAHRIGKAIEVVCKNYEKPLHIAPLARQLGMSASSLQHHFKAVTAMSPLQFQKQLRLQEARRLLLAGDFDAANAGYRVGYDDPSHFSREYKRYFGEPPMRHVVKLRNGPASRLAPRESAMNTASGAIGT